MAETSDSSSERRSLLCLTSCLGRLSCVSLADDPSRLGDAEMSCANRGKATLMFHRASCIYCCSSMVLASRNASSFTIMRSHESPSQHVKATCNRIASGCGRAYGDKACDTWILEYSPPSLISTATTSKVCIRRRGIASDITPG